MLVLIVLGDAMDTPAGVIAQVRQWRIIRA